MKSCLTFKIGVNNIMEDYWERCCFDWEEIPNTIYDSFWDDMYYEYTYPPEFYTPFNLMSPHPN